MKVTRRDSLQWGNTTTTQMQTIGQSEKSGHEPIKGWTQRKAEWLNDSYKQTSTPTLKELKSEREVHFFGLPLDNTKYSWYLDRLQIWDVGNLSQIWILERNRTLTCRRLIPWIADGVHSTEETDRTTDECDVKYRRFCSKKCPSECRTATHCFVCTEDLTPVLQSWTLHRRLHATRLTQQQ